MKQEFQLKNFRLDYPDISVFTTSPWFSPSVFCLYRLVLALYTSTWSVLGGVMRLDDGPKWFIFLTNWSYTFLNLHFILSLFIFVYYNFIYTKRRVVACDPNANGEPEKQEIQESQLQLEKPDKPASNLRHPRMLVLSCKASWVIFNIAFNIAFLVTAMYWCFDYVPGQHVDSSNVNAHAVNAILVIIDVMMCDVPIRICHVIYPLIYGLIYTVFTAIYWAVGGTNHKGQKYIYAVLDYENNAGLAVLMAAMFLLIAVPLSQLLLFGLYKVRVCLRLKSKQRSTKQQII